MKIKDARKHLLTFDKNSFQLYEHKTKLSKADFYTADDENDVIRNRVSNKRSR